MKKLFLIILLIPAVCFSQSKISIVRDTTIKVKLPAWPHYSAWIHCVILSNDSLLKVGDNIKLGKGTLPNGDYNWIATPSNSMEAKLKAKTPKTSLEIVEIKKNGRKKYGYSYVIVCKGNFIVQFEDALLAGEIIYP